MSLWHFASISSCPTHIKRTPIGTVPSNGSRKPLLQFVLREQLLQLGEGWKYFHSGNLDVVVVVTERRWSLALVQWVSAVMCMLCYRVCMVLHKCFIFFG